MNDKKHSKMLMQRRFGPKLTAFLQIKYNEIESNECFYQIQKNCTGKIESLSGNLSGCYSVRLTSNYRLIFGLKLVTSHPKV